MHNTVLQHMHTQQHVQTYTPIRAYFQIAAKTFAFFTAKTSEYLVTKTYEYSSDARNGRTDDVGMHV